MNLNENAITDLQLVEQIRNGDMQALALLYTRHYTPLLLIARTKSPHRDAADEAVTDVFLSLLNRENELTITTSVKAYLDQSVRYRCMTMYSIATRKDELRKKYGMHLADEEPATNRMEMAELRTALYAALRLLPDQLKRAIELSYFEEKEKEDVATALGVSPATVTKYILEARKRLRKCHSLKTFLS
ncbi:RNA polymerase sigma factor [Chitinophaga sp. CF418]|uniref:RNA polymerase sigma factor n=1 Tax=Chitinophaga sp. CF418 TaxID=1855287 RepID=UPI000910157F|nr:sigma-70 family RNA polymerase sigma factor [Chitinophaga sp. CF418]SHN45700.1 RNA polymerase sigma-70 factor, ECF subfamily [Chitinophaga sp. CF418]